MLNNTLPDLTIKTDELNGILQSINIMNNKNKEIQSRREFFKNAARKSLPIVAAAMLANTPIITKATAIPMGCNDACYQGCSWGCTGGCKGDCEGSCYHGCRGGCKGSCENSCQNTCRNTCKGYCGSSCSVSR